VGLGTIVCEEIGVDSARGGVGVLKNNMRINSVTMRMTSEIPRIHFAAGDIPVFIKYSRWRIYCFVGNFYRLSQK
jgi:hypothetical protein